MTQTTFTFRIDEELKSAFAEAARAEDRSAAQLLRALMRDEVRRWSEARNHDAWFRAEVEQAMREADDPAVGRISHEAVRTSWRQQRAALERRAEGDAGKA